MMLTKTFLKTIFRDIKSSMGRFLALVGIILLGVSFYVGVRGAGPSMLKSGQQYYSDTNLADFSIVSTYGVTDDDLKVIEDDGYQVESRQSLILTANDKRINVMNWRKGSKITVPLVITGHLPKNDQEIALDELMAKNLGYKVGDTVTFKDKTTLTEAVEGQDEPLALKEKDYKISGFVTSSEYLERYNRQSAQTAASYDYYAYVSDEAFNNDTYTSLLIRSPKLEHTVPYTSDYDDQVDQETDALEDLLSKRPEEVLDGIRSDAQPSIDDAKKEIADGRKALEDGKKQLEAAEAEIEAARAQFGEATVAEQSAELEAQKAAFDEEYAEKTADLDQAEEDLNEKEQELNDLKMPEYFVMDRSQNVGYSEYQDNADRVSAIARIFPVFFGLVAALMCFTAIKRMVDEQRITIGMYRGLGYSKAQIALKYVAYAFLAAIVGSAIGVAIAYPLFPPLIFNAYSSMYDLPHFLIKVEPHVIMIAVSFIMVTTLGAALFAVWQSTHESPRELLQPKPPKKGKKIVLERWTFLWRHISFNRKMTLRNLFRYKGRNAMTVIGVAGCMALILTGFGLNDSISQVTTDQFEDVQTFDAMITFTDAATDNDRDDINQALKEADIVGDVLPIESKNVTVSKDGMNDQTLMILAPLSGQFDKMYHLMTPDRKTDLDITKDSPILTQKLAQLADIEEGDTLHFKVKGDQTDYSVKVKSLAANYLSHYLYVTPEEFKNIFDEDTVSTAYLVTYHDKGEVSTQEEDDFAESLSENNSVQAITLMSRLGSSVQDTMDGLGVITIVLVVSAALLAFVVLYSLTQINVSERMRELSTIKVLGFYNEEVSWYIFQELLALTLIGIGLGALMGRALTTFVLKTAEIDETVFRVVTNWTSYLYAAGLTLLFALIVMGVMHLVLKRVDMVEALKAQD